MNGLGATTWWIVVAGLVAAELATGTFLLLMLALGAAAGALAGHAGLGLPGQMIAAALTGGGAVLAWYLLRRRSRAQPSSRENQAVFLDIGCPVQVERWEADGTCFVQHRGARWSARWQGEGAPEPGAHVIRDVQGSCLILGR